MLKFLRPGIIILSTIVSAHTLAAPTYEEKVSEIRERVRLSLSQFGSAIDRIDAVNQVYDLMFNSNKSHYFSKESGLIHSISLRDYNIDFEEEDLAGVIAIRGHELTWPLGFDLRDRVAASLDEEHTTLVSLLEIRHMLKNTYENLKFSNTRNYERASNRSNLENLENLQMSLSASPELRSAFAQFPNTLISDVGGSSNESGVELYRGFDWENNPYSTATIHLGHNGIFDHAPSMDQATLDLALKIAYLDGFGTAAGYWMKSEAFKDSLVVFDSLLNDAEIKDLLKANNVQNVEFDEDFRRRSQLFTGHKLILGTTIDDMKLVINLLFR